MQIAYTPEQEQLRDELRAYYDKLLTDEAGNRVGWAGREADDDLHGPVRIDLGTSLRHRHRRDA